MAHEDDEPLLPLMDHDNTSIGRTKVSSAQHDSQHQEDDIVKFSKLSGSTVNDSIMSTSSGPEDERLEHHHHHHSHLRSHTSHSHVHKDIGKSSMSTEDHHHHHHHQDDAAFFHDTDEEDEPSLLQLQKKTERDQRRLKIAVALCGTFFIIELLGALWSDSLALLSDSFHLLSDIVSFAISLAAIYLSHRPSTAVHTFGYHRAEVLGALFSIFLIWGLTLALVVEAYDRIRNPININGKTMAIIAGLGVFVNIILMFVLGGHHHHHGDDHEHGHSHGFGHSHTHQGHVPLQAVGEHDHDLDPLTHKSHSHHEHDHDHSHSHSHDHGHSNHHHHVNLNITAATLHVLGDLLSSIGVLISSLFITFFPDWTYLDPICTFVFSILVIGTTLGVFKRSVSILMESVPRGMDSEEIKEAICDVPGVLEVKTLYVWSLTIGQAALAGEIYLQPEIKDLRKAAAIVTTVRRMIKKRYGIKKCTIQVALYTQRASSSSLAKHGTVTATATGIHNGDNSSGSAHSTTNLPAKHDHDIIFSIEDEDEDNNNNNNPFTHPGDSENKHLYTHSHVFSHETTRAGTPLSQYRNNRHKLDNGDDESETEMEQETPLRTESTRWS
ncbi:cation efflux family-domain-containing protein [Lobosporangium transversale]|uniref:Cation efflux family-domain-containing protein n=1 Tax=Lobosporangium transversale TaxID=64571 RepID=A0A1Y2GQF0_9FUNG|nr:cation efflux family-domain-containing protein [Lobosporangium transversale]ORZ16824.1 cation efflux family-domain-containing protein [Lobosporangium transversale]|eukprot:XP_021881759.1 cation efflux family-domain-containing protein [Lobosporangium transversale]